MPRSAANRSFGFRSPGLVRILTAADPGEVFKALEELGLAPGDPSTLFSRIKKAIGEFILAPFEELFKVIDDAITVLEAVTIKTSQEVVPGQGAAFDILVENQEAIAQLRRVTSRLDTAIANQRGSNEAFATELAKIEEQTEVDIAITFL